MKILIITPSVYPYAIGGAQTHTYYVARGLAKRNVVKIVSIGKFSLSETKDQVTFNLVTILKKSPLPTIMFLAKCFPLIHKFKADIILVDLVSSETFIAPIMKFLFKIPYVITCHGSEIRRYKKNRNYFRDFDEAIKNVVIKNAASVVAVSKEIAMLLVRDWGIPKDRISLIGNGYDPEIVYNGSTITDKQPVKLVFAGRLVLEKDLFTLLKAVNNLLNWGNNVVLNIVGDGPYLKKLKSFSVENELPVNFLGRLEHNKVIEVISESDIFVLSSIEEGLPIVIIEAMSLGKPVIATAVGGIPEIVSNGVNGYLVPPKSPESLARAIQLLSTDSLSLIRLSKNAIESVRCLSWPLISDRYEDLLLQILKK